MSRHNLRDAAGRFAPREKTKMQVKKKVKSAALAKARVLKPVLEQKVTFGKS